MGDLKNEGAAIHSSTFVLWPGTGTRPQKKRRTAAMVVQEFSGRQEDIIIGVLKGD